MNNYYDDHFKKLMDEQQYTKDEAVLEIINNYLKNNKNTFWDSQLWEVEFDKMVNSNLLDLALNQYFRSKEINKFNLLIKIAIHNPIAIKQAIKYSKIFLKKIKNYQSLKVNIRDVDKSFDEFFLITDKIQHRYKKLESELKKSDSILNKYSYLEVFYLIGDFYKKSKEKYQNYTGAFQRDSLIFSMIIKKRFNTDDIRKKDWNKKYINSLYIDYSDDLYYDNKMLEFIKVYQTYFDFIRYEVDVLNTYCYDDNYQVKIVNNTIILQPENWDIYLKWWIDGAKQQEYYNWLDQILFEENNNNKNEINDWIINSFKKTLITADKIYGIKDAIKLDKKVIVDREDILTFLLSENTLQTLAITQDVVPIRVQEEKEFIFSFNQRNIIKNTKKILDFWLFGKDSNIYEKPLFKVKDHIISLPYFQAHHDVTPTFINNILHLSSKLHYRKNYAHESELTLSKTFINAGFRSEAGYNLPNAPKSIGDVDVLCVKDNHLFIIEMKSTYIRIDLDENWIHHNRDIAKAGNQLQKRKRYIEKLLNENNKEFIEIFGKPKYIHTWIIDTSFEADHEYFVNSLKISMFEITYALNKYNDEFYPNGFEINEFIKNIESAKIWENLDKPLITKKEATYTIPLS